MRTIWKYIAARMGALRCVILATACGLMWACSTDPLISGARLSSAKPAANGPVRVAVLPVDVRILETGFSGKEDRVVAWEESSKQEMVRAFDATATEEARWVSVRLDNTSEQQEALIEQHKALFATLVPQMLLVKSDEMTLWEKKRAQFDYSIGPGLRTLATQRGIDLFVFLMGQDKVRTTGKRVFDTVMNLNPITMGRKAADATLLIGVARADTGDLIWFDNDFSTNNSLNSADDVRAWTRTQFEKFLASGTGGQRTPSTPSTSLTPAFAGGAS